jgi:uncharacterized protein (DUF849 family)
MGAGNSRGATTVAHWAIGDYVRTGMEDNMRPGRHALEPSKAALVRQVVEPMPRR